MSIKDMGSGDVYLIDSSEYLTPEAVEKHNVKKCSPGSILLSFKLTVGRVGIAASEMVTNEAIACFSSDDSRKLAYLYPLLKSYDYASLGSTSSIAVAVNSRMIKAMIIKMPSSAALDRYYAQAEPIYDLLLDNAKETAALVGLRDALLPRLMSGEIDVSEVEVPTQLNNHFFKKEHGALCGVRQSACFVCILLCHLILRSGVDFFGYYDIREEQPCHARCLFVPLPVETFFPLAFNATVLHCADPQHWTGAFV